jgi:hypothetical protein
MASPPPPYANVTGISRAVMKDSPQETFANYDGNARAGELVVNLDVDPPTLYIGNSLGNLNEVTGGGGNASLPLSNGNSQFNIAAAGGNVTITSNGTQTWTFAQNGTVGFPTLTTDLHNGGNQSAQTLQFGDPNQQVIITGPTPDANINAQRLIIQGQRGNGTGEGGDVYFWGGDADTNGGDIKIYAGDADSATGYGGYINLDGGNGPDGGGQITITGGSSSNGTGGQISISGGSSANANGSPVTIQGGQGSQEGGLVSINGGYGQGNAQGVTIFGGQSGLGLSGYGNVRINSGASSWTFDNTGNVVLAGGNSVVQSIANSSLDPLNPNVSTMVLTPDANYSSQVLVLDPTAPGHIHLRAYASSNIDEPSANIFLGGENTAFEVTAGANNQALIHSNNFTWTFGNDGVLTLPGNLISSGASPAPTISGFSSISTLFSVTTPVPLANLVATAGARAFASDANLVASGNFGANVSNGGSNTVPVWSDGTNWYIG